MPTIPKGRHRPYWPTFGILFDPQSMRRRVWFDKSCRYDIGSDQDDTNKLFGWSYITWSTIKKFTGQWIRRNVLRQKGVVVVPIHHYDSVRFGWHYDIGSGRMFIKSYCYTAGRKTNEELLAVNIGEWNVPEIRKYELYYVFIVDGQEVGRVHTGRHTKRWAYPLGCYFGGNNPAPQDVTIKIK